jgi:hypothetical protein
MYRVLCSFLVWGVPLCAQTAFGYLEGTVHDQSGAQLRRATVTVTNTATSEEHSGQTGADGNYRIENLPPANYSVRVSAAGFTAVQCNDVEMEEGKPLKLDVTLPRPEATAVSVVTVIEPLPISASSEDLKASQREVAGLRDRLALSADQQIKARAIFQDRQAAIAEIRVDGWFWPSERREKIKTIRSESEAKFRALLNQNQLDEYDEILRERRERALRGQQSVSSLQ